MERKIDDELIYKIIRDEGVEIGVKINCNVPYSWQ